MIGRRVAGRLLLEMVHRVVVAEQRRMTPIHHRRQFLLLQLSVMMDGHSVLTVMRLGSTHAQTQFRIGRV